MKWHYTRLNSHPLFLSTFPETRPLGPPSVSRDFRLCTLVSFSVYVCASVCTPTYASPTHFPLSVFSVFCLPPPFNHSLRHYLPFPICLSVRLRLSTSNTSISLSLSLLVVPWICPSLRLPFFISGTSYILSFLCICLSLPLRLRPSHRTPLSSLRAVPAPRLPGCLSPLVFPRLPPPSRPSGHPPRPTRGPPSP